MNDTTKKELAHTVGDFINTVILIADENKCDRDSLIERAAHFIAFVVQVGTSAKCEPVETTKDKHWNECRQIALYDDQIKQMQEHIDRLKGIIDGLCGYIAEQNS